MKEVGKVVILTASVHITSVQVMCMKGNSTKDFFMVLEFSLIIMGSLLIIAILIRRGSVSYTHLATAIDNRMAVLEEKISILKEADMTLDHIVIMNEVADNLEAVQKSMGTVEEYQATIDNLMDLDETLKVASDSRSES